MKCHPVRHGSCGAHRGRGLRRGGSRHEQQGGAYALSLSRACVRMRDGGGESAAAEGLGREVQKSLYARLVNASLTQHFYFTEYSN